MSSNENDIRGYTFIILGQWPLFPPPAHPGRSLTPNPTQQKATTVPGKEIKKRQNLTYAVKLELSKLVESGQSKSSVRAKFGINESIEENKKSTGVKKKGLPISEIKKLLEYGL